LVDQRLQAAQRGLGAGDVLDVERLADALEAGTQTGPERTVVLAPLDVLPVGLEGRLVTLCHYLDLEFGKIAKHGIITGQQANRPAGQQASGLAARHREFSLLPRRPAGLLL